MRAPCPVGDGEPHALRRPYGSRGRTYRYTALLCPACPAVLTLGEVGVQRYDQLTGAPPGGPRAQCDRVPGPRRARGRQRTATRGGRRTRTSPTGAAPAPARDGARPRRAGCPWHRPGPVLRARHRCPSGPPGGHGAVVGPARFDDPSVERCHHHVAPRRRRGDHAASAARRSGRSVGGAHRRGRLHPRRPVGADGSTPTRPYVRARVHGLVPAPAGQHPNGPGARGAVRALRLSVGGAILPVWTS